MSEENKTITTEQVKETVAKLNATNAYRMLGVLDGMKVMPDLSGYMCGDNEYIVIVGKKLWNQMQAMATIKDKNNLTND